MSSLLLLTTLLDTNAGTLCRNLSVWSLESLEVLPPENDALLAARLPLPKTSLPQEGGDESNLIMDLFQKISQVTEVSPMQSALQVGEKKKVTRGEVGTVRRMSHDTPTPLSEGGSHDVSTVR